MTIDFASVADQVGPDKRYFLDEWPGRSVKLLVEHATGEPKYAVVDDKVIPYDEWKAANQRPASVDGGVAMSNVPGKFAFNVSVSNPPTV